ncbi:pentapeptide repeat-containing protein [Coleofasciculus sp. E1-EBD-02]|uniref:pentapeptide repeat-containing protein n=1 Tax=Coleofasciculus sp. E1-EBD-02 TaxID=3068481 RepID=UPI0032F9E3F5
MSDSGQPPRRRRRRNSAMADESSHSDQSTQPQHQGQLTRSDRQEIVDLLRQESAENFLKRAREIGLNPATDFAELNLSGVDLSHASFQDADLTGVNLSQANLSNTHLNHTKLTNANLQQANLQRSNLSFVDLSGANLKEANLSDVALSGNPNLSQANLQQADLSNAHLNWANLTDATLEDANLQNARLESIKLQGAKCDRANFQGARFGQGDDFSHISFKGANFANVSLYKLDFSHSDLSNANFEKSILEHVNFSNANLQQANLPKVNLSYVNLSHANLKSANLQGADLEGVLLQGTIIDTQTQLDPTWRKIWAIFNNQVTEDLDLRNADLSRQDFQGMNLAGANLQSTKLFSTNFRNTNLSGADLRNASYRELCLAGANLTDANLSGLNLRSINLSGANLQGANLNRVMLEQADLSGANLQGANLDGAILEEADLSGANLQGVNLDGAILKNTVINSATQLDPKWQLVWEILNNSQCGRELSGVDLSNANLSRANLENANLKGANLTGVDLSEANLLGTQIDQTTNLDPMWRRAWAAVNSPLDAESSNYVIRKVMPAILEPYRDRIEATAKPYLGIHLVPDDTLTWWNSKFPGEQISRAGLPYLPKGMSYPQTPEGEYLHLLIQINFAEAPSMEPFPRQGILQVFIADSGYYGCLHEHYSEFDKTDWFQQTTFCIRYFADPDMDEANLETNFDFLPDKNPELRDLDAVAEFSIVGAYPPTCSAIQWWSGYEFMPTVDYQFYDVLFHDLDWSDRRAAMRFIDEFTEAYEGAYDSWGEVFEVRTNEETTTSKTEDSTSYTHISARLGGYTLFPQEDPREGSSGLSHIGGYTTFSQEDPNAREYSTGFEGLDGPLDTMLLLIDTSGEVLWFYIQQSDLVRQDFSRVFYVVENTL